ncbi:MAG: hypothetical protein NT144_08805 [Bacteroidia bacterium]|nr:hypothetical protein [Bacteroidia bacterium]
MKTSTLFLLIAFMILLPAASNGQVGNLLKNKLNKVVNAGAKTAVKDVSNKVDTTAQKGVVNSKDNAVTEVEDKNNSGQSVQSAGGTATSQGGFNVAKMMGNKITLKYKEEYGFTSRIYMVIETYDKKEVTKMDFYMYYNTAGQSIGIETKTLGNENGEAVAASIVMDGENKCSLMLTDVNGMKMGMISAIPDENTAQPDETSAKKTSPPTFTKTGNTKVIAGYKCDEYSFTSTVDKTSGKVWFTKEVNLKIDKRGWKNTGMSSYYGNSAFNDGIILANEAYDDKGKLTMKSETKEINENFPHSVSIKGYTLRQM